MVVTQTKALEMGAGHGVSDLRETGREKSLGIVSGQG